ncbi:MAG TPA: gamma-glutamyltransferase [Chitinophagaceae bacterium]|nr:gamma-glutamyltransferase [Chitinophagaceae bacterium]
MHIMLKTGLLTCCLLAACHSARRIQMAVPDAFHYTIQKNVTCTNGAVVSAHPLASEVGLAILRRGGNAVDAAIATQLALAVVYPGAGNLGGGGFMVARLQSGKLLALDYRESAPGRASRDMYLDTAGNPAGDRSINGHLAAGVPGTVAGLVAASRYGRLPFRELVQPAIDLAEKGFAITRGEAASLNAIQADLKRYNTITPVFLRDRPWKAGDTLVQADLAATLRRIRDKGVRGFYEGTTARLIVSEMQRGGGLVSLEDLRRYRAKFREPHVFTYKGYTVVGMPMPSSGGILLHQMMKMVEPRHLDKLGFQTLSSVQLMTEVERRAFADRAKYMGDADYYRVPVDSLVSDTYLARRMQDYDPHAATDSRRVQPGVLPLPESEQTTHLSVLDRDGNAVAVTTTLNNSYGCKTVVGGAGFFLNDEMDDFSMKPGVPNLYGAVGGEANAIAPGKRMLSSMTPTLVLQENKPFLVVGTPGGTTIPTSVFQTLVNILDFGLSTQDAVYLPKFHHQWLPDSILVEAGFPEAVRLGLENMGYKVYQRSAIGRTEVIRVDQDGRIEAVADRRGEDDAAGY